MKNFCKICGQKVKRKNLYCDNCLKKRYEESQKQKSLSKQDKTQKIPSETSKEIRNGNK